MSEEQDEELILHAAVLHILDFRTGASVYSEQVLDLEDETINPKYAQLAVKNYLQKVGFPKDTTLEIGGMEIGIYL